MTHAAVPALLRQPEIAALLLPKMLSRQYDQHFRPLGDKAGITLGMGMTEKQGGTDVRANTTRAEPAGAAGPGEAYILVRSAEHTSELQSLMRLSYAVFCLLKTNITHKYRYQ